MAEKCKDAVGASVPAKEISIERLAFDLFRHITREFHLQPEVVYQSNLPKNNYTSETFIQDIARPVLFNAIVGRDAIKKICSDLKAEMEDNMNGLSEFYDQFFVSEYNETRERPIYMHVVISLSYASELAQYLNDKGKRELLEFMPEIWANLFKNRLHDDLEQNGGFDKYISYWEFLKPTDGIVSTFLESCTPYDSAVSDEFKETVKDTSWFKNPKNRKKLEDAESVRRESESPLDPIPDPETGEKSNSSQLSTLETSNNLLEGAEKIRVLAPDGEGSS